jgi:hypothetical protein
VFFGPTNFQKTKTKNKRREEREGKRTINKPGPRPDKTRQPHDKARQPQDNHKTRRDRPKEDEVP